jgi:hypothetical protein
MIRKVKDGNAEIVECDLDPIVTGRILEGIVNMNAAIVSLLGLSVATNHQVNRDAASVVSTPSPATTAAPVQRIVRRFAALFCEYATAKRVNTANKLCNLGYVVVGASGVNQTKGADGIYCPDVGDRVWNILLKNRSSFACWFTNKVMKRFFKAPIGTSGRPFNADRY